MQWRCEQAIIHTAAHLLLGYLEGCKETSPTRYPICSMPGRKSWAATSKSTSERVN